MGAILLGWAIVLVQRWLCDKFFLLSCGVRCQITFGPLLMTTGRVEGWRCVIESRAPREQSVFYTETFYILELACVYYCMYVEEALFLSCWSYSRARFLHEGGEQKLFASSCVFFNVRRAFLFFFVDGVAANG